MSNYVSYILGKPQAADRSKAGLDHASQSSGHKIDARQAEGQ